MLPVIFGHCQIGEYALRPCLTGADRLYSLWRPAEPTPFPWSCVKAVYFWCTFAVRVANEALGWTAVFFLARFIQLVGSVDRLDVFTFLSLNSIFLNFSLLPKRIPLCLLLGWSHALVGTAVDVFFGVPPFLFCIHQQGIITRIIPRSFLRS